MLKIRLNDDAELVAEIRAALAENNGLCPCQLPKPDGSTRCMCALFRAQNEPGLCHCGLYEKYMEE